MKDDDENFVSCASCVHCMPKLRFGLIKEYEFAKCKLAVKGSTYRDKVTGKTIDNREYEYCSTARLWSSQDTYCGPDGKFWSPANKTDLFKQIKRLDTIPKQASHDSQVAGTQRPIPPKAPNGPSTRVIIEGVGLKRDEE